MRPDDLFYSVATGSKRLRILLTPVGLLVFAGLLLLVIFGSLYTDGALGFPKLLSGTLGSLIGVILFAAGLLLLAWCVVWFTKAKGTPVPFNPPREIVTVGPYAWSRNPMLTGSPAYSGLGSYSILYRWSSFGHRCSFCLTCLN